MFRKASIGLWLAVAPTFSGCGDDGPRAQIDSPPPGVVEEWPRPDARGVISYPSHQVALARRGDTVADVANRIGLNPERLAGFNGLEPNTEMRLGELLALPSRIAESDGRGRIGAGTLTGTGVGRSGNAAGAAFGATPERSNPARHKTLPGETIYTISRLYNVPVRSLADWNGLGADFEIRVGQYLIIPVAPKESSVNDTAGPGEGASIAPAPPSASTPLPRDTTIVVAPLPPSPDLATATPDSPRMLWPVSGKVIRDFSKGETEGIDIAAPAGSQVKAADAGTVAAITRDTDQVPIMVLRHENNLLSVYANIADISVEKGDSVSRGQNIAKVPQGDPSFLYFEVRQGFESVDPNEFLN